MNVEAAAARYIAFCEGMTPASLDQLGDYCAPSIHFRDPFNEATDIDGYRRVLAKMFEDTGQPDFTVSASALHGNSCYLRWRFSFQRAGGRMSIEGMSEIRFNADGLVDRHFDFWDAGQVYETVPLLRSLVHLVKRRLRADHRVA
jgi:steroid delta-isomerase